VSVLIACLLAGQNAPAPRSADFILTYHYCLPFSLWVLHGKGKVAAASARLWLSGCLGRCWQSVLSEYLHYPGEMRLIARSSW
jgi:hypothetical protein